MLARNQLRAIIGIRKFCATPTVGFKFKLTEDMSKQFEEDQKAKKKPDPPLAITTKENNLLMGRVSHERYKQVVKIGVPKHRLNTHYLLFVRETDNVQALDPNDIAKPGDWVMIRRDPDTVDERVPFVIERVIYSRGEWIDPLTGRRSFGIYYDDDLEQLEKIKLEV